MVEGGDVAASGGVVFSSGVGAKAPQEVAGWRWSTPGLVKTAPWPFVPGVSRLLCKVSPVDAVIGVDAA